MAVTECIPPTDTGPSSRTGKGPLAEWPRRPLQVCDNVHKVCLGWLNTAIESNVAELRTACLDLLSTDSSASQRFPNDMIACES